MKRSLFHPPVHTVRRLFSGTRLRLSAGPRLPIPTTVFAHGRTPNQHHNHGSSSPALAANVETEPAVFTSDVVLPTRVEQHPSVITVLLAPVTRVSAATIAPRKVCAGKIASLLIQLTIASFQNLRTKIARIFFRAAANHIESPFTQRLLVPQITRLQMSHPTATNSVNHATRSA